jgi:hypothetical protein
MAGRSMSQMLAQRRKRQKTAARAGQAVEHGHGWHSCSARRLPDSRFTSREGRGCPCPERRTFATGILPSTHSMLPSLRHPGFARPATPSPGHGQPLPESRSDCDAMVSGRRRDRCEDGERRAILPPRDNSYRPAAGFGWNGLREDTVTLGRGCQCPESRTFAPSPPTRVGSDVRSPSTTRLPGCQPSLTRRFPAAAAVPWPP